MEGVKQSSLLSIQEHLLKNNFEQKILSLKILDNFKKSNFELFEFKKFYEDLEKELIYKSQNIINESLTPSMLLEEDSILD